MGERNAQGKVYSVFCAGRKLSRGKNAYPYNLTKRVGKGKGEIDPGRAKFLQAETRMETCL